MNILLEGRKIDTLGRVTLPAEIQQIKIINPNGNIHIDLNMDYDEQIFSNFFFDYEWFICWFGDNAGRKNKKVNGYNVIHLL